MRDRSASQIPEPVGRSQFRAARDYDRSQTLIADQREKGIIGDGAALSSTATDRTVARFAKRLVCGFATLPISDQLARIRSRRRRVENSRLTPTRTNFLGQYVDLRDRHHSAGALGESRHRGAGNALCDNFADGSIIRDSKINRIGERDRGPSPPFRTVTAGAVLREEKTKIQDLVRRQNLGITTRLAVRRAAPCKENRSEGRKATKMAECFHGRFSSLFHCETVPVASIPARRTNGRFSCVQTGRCRKPPLPPPTPK